MATRRAEEWRTEDGARLHLAHVLPEGSARAHVLVVHGFAEHGGRYAGFAEALAAAGIAAHVPDLRGHGHSSGPRSVVHDAGVLALDLIHLLERLQAEGGALGLFGHSFGGALALRVAQERPDLLDAVVATAPYLTTALRDPPWMFRLSAAASYLLPRLRTRPLDAGAVSRDPEEVDRYREDPLVDRGGVPLASVRELHALGPRILAEAERLVTPVLIVHGTRDRLADARGSRRLAGEAASSDLTLRLVEDGAHDLLHDVGGERARAGIVDWLVDRLGLLEATMDGPLPGGAEGSGDA